MVEDLDPAVLQHHRMLINSTAALSLNLQYSAPTEFVYTHSLLWILTSPWYTQVVYTGLIGFEKICFSDK